MAEPFITELNVPVVFRERPIAIPGDLRPTWRISVLSILLRKCCRQGKSSLQRLHVLSWAVRSKEVGSSLAQSVEGEIPPDSVLVRIEPAVNRAIDLAIGEGILRRSNRDRVELTNKGKKFADSILENQLVLSHEKDFIDQVRFSITESFVTKMFNLRGTS